MPQPRNIAMAGSGSLCCRRVGKPQTNFVCAGLRETCDAKQRLQANLVDESLCHSSNARHARVAELADALDLGSCAGNGVGVRLPPLALLTTVRKAPVGGFLGPFVFAGSVADQRRILSDT
jgi:hypothetical protein